MPRNNYREHQNREAAGCVLIIAALVATLGAIMFLVASQTNVGLVTYSAPSLPLLTAVCGGFAAIVSLAGSWVLWTESYSLRCPTCAECMQDCLESCDPVDVNSVQGQRRRRERRERSAYRPVDEGGYKAAGEEAISCLSRVLQFLIVCLFMAAGIVIMCLARSSHDLAIDVLGSRWELLHQSQEGFAILRQCQDEFECCGFANDLDNPAQPCAVAQNGSELAGCGESMQSAHGIMLLNIGLCNLGVMAALALSLFFARKERTRAFTAAVRMIRNEVQEALAAEANGVDVVDQI